MSDVGSGTGGGCDAGRVVLDAVVRIDDVAALKTRLAEARDRAPAVEIDGGAVRTVDTAAIQLLLAFALDLRAWSVPLRWSAVSAELDRAVADLGLTAHLWRGEERPAGDEGAPGRAGGAAPPAGA